MLTTVVIIITILVMYAGLWHMIPGAHSQLSPLPRSDTLTLVVADIKS